MDGEKRKMIKEGGKGKLVVRKLQHEEGDVERKTEMNKKKTKNLSER